MENIMYIKWDTGDMTIDLDVFFPATLTKFKKLLKVIALDWENCDRLVKDLKIYFQNKIVECDETAKQADSLSIYKQNTANVKKFQRLLRVLDR